MSIKRFFLVVLSISGLLLSVTGMASQTGCPEHFANGIAPDFINQKLTAKTREVCYSGFALKHSGITRTPLYAAEHLTRDRLMQGKGLKRQSQFHPDDNIPRTERSELRHYSRSGYDRGHVAPSADMFDLQSQFECFSLANMIPQVPENNRGPWEGIESAVRMMAKSKGDIYVITGPIYQGSNIEKIGGAVMVPTKLFKAVYDPQRREAGAYLIDNIADAQPEKISITELEKITGISIFPSVEKNVKSRLMRLPEPKSYKERKRKGGRG
ncbi:DNA/RNA non-specific endonuclease [Pelobacter propionicus]|uniref:DNA/RNA non-specific endonuclease n=1 Tax=Pelobacter propionicus (strain DSM 2379 / NBRC 103807 / OttBd1) TaxID=338966 RepID=A1AKE1_PELPD|nr:DNA/RNA non-specific endonuclease [Pelobacter propionicus]ABK97811.1 DNA/RNA non-specific endonuclease [Pelobacter propionicus DSM 2379]